MPMGLDLTGRIALVTGGGRGIGARIAARMAEHGASVCVADVSAESAASCATALGDDAVEKEVVPLDDAADRAGECDALDFVGIRNVVRAVHACFLLFVGERASIQVIGCNQAQQHSAAIVLLL